MDRFQAGAIAGLVGTLPTFIVNWLAKLLRLSPAGYSMLAGHLLTQSHGHSLAVSALGAVADLSVGAGLGVVYAYTTPEDPPLRWLRGALFGGAAWFLLMAMGHLLKIQPIPKLQPIAMFSYLATNIVFGIVVAYALPRIGRRFLLKGDHKRFPPAICMVQAPPHVLLRPTLSPHRSAATHREISATKNVLY